MKHVVIDISSAVPVSGLPTGTGIGRTTYELVHTLDAWKDLPFQLGLFVHRLRNLPFSSTEFSTPIHHLRLPRWKVAYWLTRSLPIVEHMTKADLIHDLSNTSNAHKMDRVVLTIHDAMYFSSPEIHLHNPAEAARMVWNARQCRAIITCSKCSKLDIVKYTHVNPDKITVIPWGYNRHIFYPEKDTSALRRRLQESHGIINPYFFSVSCNIGRKRSDILLEQYLELLQDTPVNDLVLVWRNPPSQIMAMIQKKRIAKRIHILHTVTDEELSDLYRGATALLFPSIYEGFGLPVLEAMACGTPVVTTRAASLPEVGGDAALYLSSENDSELLEYMRQFENGSIDCGFFTRKSLDQASKFSWERCVAHTIKVYRDCLGS